MKSRRRLTLLSRRWAPALLLGTVLASACVFEPRQANDPVGEEVPWIRPTEPEAVLVNMKAAVEFLTSTNYENSLAPDFSFLPSPLVDQIEPGYFDAFGRSREVAHLTRLYPQVDSLRVEWNFDPETDLTGDASTASIVLRGYAFYVSYKGGNQVVYEGYAELSLRYEGGQWVLGLWDESPSNANLPWGRLRLDLDI